MALLPADLKLLSTDGSVAEAEAFFHELVPGRVVSFYYEDDPNIWHERLLLWPSVGVFPNTCWTCLTPDGDVYPEEMAAGPDGDGPSRVSLTMGATPAALRPPGRIYKFRSLPAEADMIQLFREARVAARVAGLVDSEPTVYMRGGDRPSRSTTVSFLDVPGFVRPPRRVARKGPPALPPLAAPAAGGADADDGALADGGDGGTETPKGGPGPAVLADESVAPSGSAWYVMKTIPNECQQLDEVVPKAGDVIWGESGLYCTAGGFIVPIELHPVPLPVDVMDKMGDDDARILGPLQRTREGRRHRDFREAVTAMRQEKHDDFPLVGDRSFKWLCEYIVDHGGTPDGRHTKWMMESGCTKDSAAAHLHDLLGFAIELGVTYDQVDGSNLASMEVVSGAYQLIEETMGSMKIEGVEHYIGRQKQSARRGVAMAPGVAKYATDQLAKETEIQKQRRKAREEKTAQAGKNKG